MRIAAIQFRRYTVTFPDIRWRSVLLPGGVALAALACLAFYNFVRIPAQQQYLNERNLRLLRTSGAQIKSKIDNFDLAIDHAIDSFPNEAAADRLGDYVKLFAPELEIQQFSRARPIKPDAPEVEKSAVKSAGDPPRITIQRDEGTNYIYLGYKRRSTIVLAKADIEEVVAPYLSVANEFDAVLLADRNGRVLAQRSSAGLELARVDRLRPATPSPTQSKDKTDPGDIFESLRVSSNSQDIVIGDGSYKLYIQPIQLSLASLPSSPIAGSKPGAESADKPEEWALCGLVRADHFRESYAISYTSVLLFAAALVAICLVIPLLKPHILNPRERLRRVDGALIAVSAFLVTALITFSLLDAYRLVNALRTTDDQLKHTAEEFWANLKSETETINAQMDEIEEDVSLGNADSKYGPANHSGPHRQSLTRFGQSPRPQIQLRKKGIECTPPEACRDQLLSWLTNAQLDTLPYPYFEIVAWNDGDGQQRVKWTTLRVTPFLDLNKAKIPYFQDLKRARLAGVRSSVPNSGVSVFQSPNTGEKITVFWKALDPLSGVTPSGHISGDIIGESLSTAPVSLDSPVLPGDLQFAVIDDTNHVLFHSDPTRSLKEDFVQECEDYPTLRSTILGRRGGFLTAHYRGRPHRLYIKPLSLSQFGQPDWSLVVFQNTIVPETANLYTLISAAVLFGAYGAVLGGAWALLFLFARKRGRRWFWPDGRKGQRYRTVAAINAVLALMGLAAVYIYDLPPRELVVATGLMTFTACALTHVIVTRRDPPVSECATWQQAFWWARTLFLFVIAAVPAVVCFHIADEFETRLLIKRAQLRLAMDLDARQERIRKRAAELDLCPRSSETGRTCDKMTTFIEKRGKVNGAWDVHSLPFFNTQLGAATAQQPGDRPPSWVDSVLRRVYLPVNDVSIELAAVATDDGAPATDGRQWTENDASIILMTAPRSHSGGYMLTSKVMRVAPTIWDALLIGGLLFALYALLRYGVQPLFALDLRREPPSHTPTNGDQWESNLLLVGPPGSGKTARLRKSRGIRTFDVRTLEYVERRRDPRPVDRDRRAPSPAANVVMPGAGLPRPPVWFDYSTLPCDPKAVVGIDHLDQRLDEPDRRDQMLQWLEELLYRHDRKVWIAADRDPLELVHRIFAHANVADARTSGRTNVAESVECERWCRVLQSFRKELVGVGREGVSARRDSLSALMSERGRAVSDAVRSVILEECALTERLLEIGENVITRLPDDGTATVEEVMIKIGNAAEPYYRSLWSLCSTEEKLTLRQLAEEDLVNPNNQRVVFQLMRDGLVAGGPGVRIVSQAFRRFVLEAVPRETISVWEREGVRISWGSVEMALATGALALGSLLVLTQEQLIGAWIGFVPTLVPAVLVPAVPTVLKLLAGTQRGAKTEASA
jgi:hypothetical protein